MNKQKWWGYIHENGNIQVKPVTWNIDDMLDDAHESPFCKRVFSPFEATGREDAIEIIKKQIS